MAEYNTLKETIQSSVIARPFTRIPGKPSWEDKENLLEEAEEMSLEMEVSYNWSDGYGLLAEVQGAAKYLVTTGLAYVAPVRPDAPRHKYASESSRDKTMKRKRISQYLKVSVWDLGTT